MDYILASASPRRKELLAMAGLSFRVCAPDIEESIPPGMEPAEAARALATQKAAAVAAEHPESCVIAADTIVVLKNKRLKNKNLININLKKINLENKKNKNIKSKKLKNIILGKPKDSGDAARMLRMLSGETHTVITGVCVCQGARQLAFAQKTRVSFYPLSEDEIARYIQSGEPLDKAGAYGIQGLGGLLVKKIEGDYFNVVGLPVARLMRELRQFKGEG
ncbi:MAG: Maf family protein [Oscillospiraceae bacterium]|nr:Maf family protein [Oscillospiraceae bacterium]